MTPLIIFGIPGSGKGTQANLLAYLHGFVHFDTGAYLRGLFADPKNGDNSDIQEKRVDMASGRLLEPLWVLGMVRSRMRELAGEGRNVVFSGSPRTTFEAFGGEGAEGLFAALEDAYGVQPECVFLDTPEDVALGRIVGRTTCSYCACLPIAPAPKSLLCPLCGAGLKSRAAIDDTPERFAARLNEYRERTLPVQREVSRRGIPIRRINGSHLPHQVNSEICRGVVG